MIAAYTWAETYRSKTLHFYKSKYLNGKKEGGALYLGLYGQWKWNDIQVPCPHSEIIGCSFGNSRYRFV